MSDYQKKLNQLLTEAASRGASDLHLGVGFRPALRIDGSLVQLSDEELLTPETAEGLVLSLLSPEQKEILAQDKELDFSYTFDNKARFRINVFYQRGFLSAALRLVQAKVPSIDDLGLPPILHDFTKLNQGFILVVGPAGHGKSTTLAALADEVNHNRFDHIITIEDPVEYIFTQDKSMVSQREVRADTLGFNRALKSVLRQDPDVIMVGEMRGHESILAAMTAAETGHLVLSTLHTNSAAQTIDRIIDSFPSQQQNQAASQLASTLAAIVSERLIPKIGGGRVPACEIMIMNSAIRNLIRERKVHQIDLVIETSAQEGMVTLNRSLVSLVKKKIISKENAQLYSLNQSELKILLER
ncbi:MAG: PilT/PilU family type 4a pilus ATPase [bacterium]|nr:PilT/PilU family type 4a pilus ATPase [bacterium]